jgi:hypothetical protein
VGRNLGGHRARFVIGADDVSAIRFAVSPSHELALAVRVMLTPGSQPLHWGWLRSLRGRVPVGVFEIVAAVVGERGYFPDFLTQAPDWDTTPESDLEAVRAVPLDEIVGDLQRVLDNRPPRPGPAGRSDHDVVRRLLEDPERGREALATAWRGLFDALLAPDWPQIDRLQRADIGLRVRRIAEVGLAAMVDGLHHLISWEDDAVRVETLSYSDDVDCAGGGLVLVPSVMNPLRCTVLTRVPHRAAIFYPALGISERWQQPRATAALAGVLGDGRARVLLALDGPRSTSEIGELCELATSTASFHLARLRDAGLVDSRRDGPRMLHVRSPLGEAVVSGGS